MAHSALFGDVDRAAWPRGNEPRASSLAGPRSAWFALRSPRPAARRSSAVGTMQGTTIGEGRRQSGIEPLWRRCARGGSFGDRGCGELRPHRRLAAPARATLRL